MLDPRARLAMLGGAMNETPTTNNKPSAGAIRAAEIIVKSLNAKGGDILITSFAVVIDRETRARELEQDKARLDFLGGALCRVMVEMDDGEGPTPPEYSVCADDNTRGHGPTLRAAIDAAMNGGRA